MKKLYTRLVVMVLLIIFSSSVMATFVTFMIWQIIPQQFEQHIFLAMRLRDILTPFVMILSCAVLITITSKKTVAPIVALSKAAKKIAEGDFDVSVKLSKRKDEISELEHSFNLMAKELKNNEIMKKDFIANVSHEFKTPLSIIQGYGKLLSDDNLTPDERREYSQKLEYESERLITLTSNILRLSKLDNQTISPMPSRFQLDEQIRQSILSLQTAWGKKNINFDIDLTDQSFEGDEELLSQVWFNLLENAIKFSEDNGAIKVRMVKMGDSVQIKITDNGLGMDDTTKKYIFEQFYQGDTSLTKEGSGLGLTIVSRIVDLHHGRIDVESRLGEGTRLIVTLPLT